MSAAAKRAGRDFSPRLPPQRPLERSCYRFSPAAEALATGLTEIFPLRLS